MLQYISSSLIIAAACCMNSFEDFDLYPDLKSMETMDSSKLNTDVREKTTNSTMDFITTAETLTSVGSTRRSRSAQNFRVHTTNEPFLIIVPDPPKPVRPFLNTTTNLYTCPEEEQPSNIGPYEVPSQRDLVLHVRSDLLAMFRSYHKKVMAVLKDIQEVTKAAWSRERVCPAWAQKKYRRCVRQVRNRCESTAKSLVSALETLREDVRDLIEGKICNISTMNTDPIQLIRILAAEKVSLEFALPGFLRLLSACAVYCSSFENFQGIAQKPPRKLTDQDLVIRHFLTRKDLSQLLKKRT